MRPYCARTVSSRAALLTTETFPISSATGPSSTGPAQVTVIKYRSGPAMTSHSA